jgi:tRNA threonylcarbamoyladenosine biosynthesis protein TsaB
MRILALRTDKPKAELYLYEDKNKLIEVKWQAHRQLAETLNSNIEEILNKSSISYDQLNGIAIYKGPGSFTGLRIGMSAANALAYGLELPIVTAGGDDWRQTAIKDLLRGKNYKIAIPDYGSPAHTTTPRK